jgi:predicted aspartyl protease
LRLRAILDEGHHAHLLVYLNFDQFAEPKPVHFLIDTGCTVTTILSDDATLLGINCENLRPCDYDTTTANGHVTPYEIDNIILIFDAQFGLLNLRHRLRGKALDKINCHTPTPRNELTPQRIETSCSLLGMDFLHLFKKWKFTKKYLFLQT